MSFRILAAAAAVALALPNDAAEAQTRTYSFTGCDWTDAGQKSGPAACGIGWISTERYWISDPESPRPFNTLIFGGFELRSQLHAWLEPYFSLDPYINDEFDTDGLQCYPLGCSPGWTMRGFVSSYVGGEYVPRSMTTTIHYVVDGQDIQSTVTLTATPEPGTLALLGLGLTGVAIVTRRRRGGKTNGPGR